MANKILLSCLLLALIGVGVAQIDCPVYYTVAYDSSTKIARCESCPKNCAYCYWDQEKSKAHCTACREKTFRRDDGVCEECATGCEVCVGPSVSDCMAIANTYVFNMKQKEITKCKEGCAACDTQGNCIRCEQGYRHNNIVGSNGEPLVIDDSIIVDCIKCSDPLCNYCDVDPQGVEFCGGCKIESGLNPKTKKCSPCPDGCLSCHSNNQICSFCKEGFMKVDGFAGCKPIDIPNCLNEDVTSKKCIWCQASFTPNPKDQGKTCATCSVVDPLCSHCKEKSENEVSNNANDLVCTGCPSRYTLDADKGTCEACPSHCTYCSPKKQCYACDMGYVLENNECKAIEVPNCETPSSDRSCSSCKAHYFLDRKDGYKCKPCDSDCLMCDGPGEEDCTSCAINKLSLRIPDENPILSFFSNTKLKCVTSCPKEFNGKHYVEHDMSRECVAQTEHDTRPKSKYPFVRHEAVKTWESIFHDSEAFFNDYLKHAKHSIENAKRWANKHPKPAAKYSAQCNYRGELIEKISASRETYYHCDCIHNVHGENCQVDHELYISIQKHVKAVMKDLTTLKTSINENLLAKIIFNLNQAPLSIETLQEMKEVIKKMIATQKLYKINDIPQFLNVVDHMIRSFYSTKNQLEHRADGYQRDIGYQKFLQIMYGQFHDLLTLSDNVFKESAGNYDYVVDASSYSFQVTDHIANSHTFKDPENIFVLSPNLLGLTELMMPVTVSVKNQYLSENYSKTRLVIWSYSRLLFPPDKRYASHLVFAYPIRVTKKHAEIIQPTMTSNDTLTIIFPVKSMPPDVDFRKALKCVALHFKNDDHVSETFDGEIADIGRYTEDDRPFVVCRYTKMLAGFYYSVVYNHDDIPQLHLAKTAMALSMDDNFHLQVSLDQKPKTSFAAIMTLKAVFATIFALVLHW